MIKLTMAQEHTVRKAAKILETSLIHHNNFMCSEEEAGQLLVNKLAGKVREEFVVLLLNASNGLITTETLSVGTVDQAAVYPRELLRRVVEHNASAVIVGHNHPSGSLEVSESDIQLTRTLETACGVFNVRLLDHIIVGDNRYVSLDNLGKL